MNTDSLATTLVPRSPPGLWTSLAVLLTGCAGGMAPDSAELTDDELEAVLALSPLPELPADPTNSVADDPAAAQLGQWLFFDTGLSSDGAVSCDSCHDPEHAFSDTEALSETLGTTERHSPSLLYTAYNDWFFWDGRCDTHWCQALGPMEHPAEMGSNRLAIAHHLHQDEALNEAYTEIFGALPDLSDSTRFPPEGRPVPEDASDPLDQAWSSMEADDRQAVNVLFSNVGKAMAAYERTLLPVDEAPFDAWVTAIAEGDPGGGDWLSSSAVEGLQLFLGEGQCHFCHSGPLFTNGEFHNIGLASRDGLDPADTGRFEGISSLLDNAFNGAGDYSDDPDWGSLKVDHLALAEEQLGQFKVPSLRTTAASPPYMHGGHFETLAEVVEYYSELDETPSIGHR
ncbi:MAG: cytochrome c peroxidase, partial [Myxococcota bacterium]|nr:cytochrome c peroxidase [Myxococcota bacterium]